MNIKFFVSDTWACGHIRGEIIARYINSQTNHQMICKGEMLYSDLFKTSHMVFQRQHNPGILHYVEEAKAKGIKVICELDDDLFCIPPESEKAHSFYARPDVQQGMVAVMQNVDALTVSTEYLAKQCQTRTDRPIFVVDNGVDFDYWEDAYLHHLRSSIGNLSVTIGWMASGTHSIDAALLKDVIPALMEKYPFLRLHLIGWIEGDDIGIGDISPFKDRIKVDPWTDIADLPMLMSDFDIGLAPLVDNNFNRSKSGVKHIQYAALGIPCVASPLVPYLPLIRDGVDGFFAQDNSTNGWYDELSRLIENQSLRTAAGILARSQMKKRYDVSVVAKHWLTTFEAIEKM